MEEMQTAPRLSVAEVETFHKRLETIHGAPIELRINQNHSTLITIRSAGKARPLRLSLHQMFLTGGEEILQALAQHLRAPTRHSQQILRRYIDAHSAQLEVQRAQPRKLKLRSRGKVYDLHELAQQVNAQFFDGKLEYHITWGRGNATRTRRRHITFGTYDHHQKLIRIHPALDQPGVPEFFMRFLIFHEMLHALIDPEHDGDGRRYVHTPKFRHIESQHPDYERAKQWEEEFMRNGS